MAEDPKDAKESALLDETLEIADGHDIFKAIEHLESQGEPLVVSQYYWNLLKKLYFEKKDVPRMVMFGRAGIRYALAQAELASANDEETATKLKGIAKAMAYDLGANAWPGWGDEGIVLTKSDLAAGLDAARVNLRLARELKRDAEKVGNGHWLIGAHLLAAGKADVAMGEFTKSIAKFREAKQPAFEQMAIGYLGITRMNMPSSKSEGQQELETAFEKLKKIGSDDAKFFAEQLQTAKKIFLK